MDTTAAYIWWNNGSEWQSKDISDAVTPDRYMVYGRAGLPMAMTPGRGDTLKVFTLIHPYPDSVSQADSSEWFAAEVGEFVSYDTGRATWTFNLITDKSEKGHGMLGSYQDPDPNKNVYLIYGSLKDVIITHDDVYVEGLRNGDDWRVYWNCTEKDRRANRWGYYQGEIYFNNPYAVTANSDDWPTDQGHVFLYHGNAEAVNPEDNPDQIWGNVAGADSYWESFNYDRDTTLWFETALWMFSSECSTEVYIKGLPDVHSMQILQGDKACYFDSLETAGYASIKPMASSDNDDYEISAWMNWYESWTDDNASRSAWLALINNDNDSMFKAGIFRTSLANGANLRFGYYDGSTWTLSDSTDRIPVRDFYYEIKLVVENDQIDVYFFDSLFASNVTSGIGAFDSIAIGADTEVKVYFDNIIVQPWMANPPELHLEPLGEGYSGKFPRSISRGVMR
jgi:hypothetical protein